MICKNCGKELYDGTKYCNECGAKIEIENTPNTTHLENDEDNTNKEFQTLDANVNFNNSKKKIIIIGVIIVLLIVVIIFIISKNSSSNNINTYDNNNYYTAENYNNDFGNNEYVTAIETEPATAKISNIKFEYPESTMYYTTPLGEKLGFKISDTKQAITNDGDIHYQIEIEVVSKELTSNHHPEALADGNYTCWFYCDYYDANGIIIDDQLFAQEIPVDDPVGTKYNIGSTTIYEWKYDVDIDKIVIREKR